MSRAVVQWPLRPSAANGSSRDPPVSRRCRASASRVIADAEERRRCTSRSSACARSSGRDIVVRFILAY